MTTSLLRALKDTSNSASWADQLQNRPTQLWQVTAQMFLSPNVALKFFYAFVIFLLILGTATLIVQWKKNQSFLWKLVLIFAIIPYPFYLVWRGNHGFFFWYYLTCHFIFLVPLLVKGLQTFTTCWRKLPKVEHTAQLLAGIFIFALLTGAWFYWRDSIFQPENNAGLERIDQAVQQINMWSVSDHATPFVVRTYTANIYTDQYDYLFRWYARAHHTPEPLTVFTGQEKTWHILIESKSAAKPYFFNPWYKTATDSGHLVRQQQIGVLTLETWQK